ncbi:protein FAM234B-like isoform X3 [Lytechinus variegatus]|uniref:protein FAM234B-like isoform X3 n=1 Tax=Lytechinus variegatus TaxID=7654 RepID=UPI001BB19D2F|nr:protein FAM234B-like isoform X3 [Lytechinus variegatus]
MTYMWIYYHFYVYVARKKDSKETDKMELGKQQLNEKEEVSITDCPGKNDNKIEFDHLESNSKEEKEQNDRADESRGPHGEIEMKFILDNQHLHTAHSSPVTPKTIRKRKNHHLDMAEMISLSGVESLCTISNYDAMSTRGIDDEEEGGDDREVDTGIGVHHLLSVLLAMMSVAIVLLLYFLVPCPMEPANWSIEFEGIDISSSGCGGGVIALSGWRGEVLWRLDTNQTNINSLVCNQLDVNNDGQLDCLAAGDHGLLIAINTKNGVVLWESDPLVTVTYWSYSQPQTLPNDLNHDGILDLVISHGVTDKTQSGVGVGRLLLLSGKTGQSLGTFLEMPDGHTSVSPPIVFQAVDDSNPFIVFGTDVGSGTSYTTPGSMWVISLEMLVCYVTESNCVTRTHIEEQQYGVSTINDHVIEIIRGKDDGFSLPAVVTDLTMDGINDLIVISDNTMVTAINGSSFKPLWSVQLDVYSGYRPTSVPAPGHFNADEVPDIIIHLESPTLKNKIVILDGLTGRDLWYTTTTSSFENKPAFTNPSPLSLKAHRQKDAFLYWIQNFPNIDTGTTTKRNLEGCSELISGYPTFNMVMMDRDLAMDPPSLLSLRPYKPIISTTSLPPSSDMTSQAISIGVSSSPESTDVTPVYLSSTQRIIKSQDCYMMEPVLTNTGVIDDLDDDGSLEVIVAINTMPTYLGSSSNSTTLPLAFLTIQQMSLQQALDQNQRIKLVQSDSFLSPSVENSTVTGNIFDHFDFLETKFQTWLGYLGTNANGRYT